MQPDEIISRLTSIFQSLFESKSIRLTPETSPRDIKDWDSMANVTLAIEIEQAFNIRIKPAQMEAIQNVGDLMAIIARQLQPAAS